MFSFLRRRWDAFQQRRKQQEVWKCLRRILDSRTVSGLRREGDERNDKRSALCLPALVLPCLDGEPTRDEPMYAVTKDLSDDGVAILACRELRDAQVIGAIWADGPIFFLGEVRQCWPFGGGFWQIGVRLSEIIPAGEVGALRSWAERLNPQAAVLETAGAP